MLIGYARVSTEDQNLDMQLHALGVAGCVRIYEDRGVSGRSRNRRGLSRALRALNRGDVLVVWRLDRLGRSLPHLIEVIGTLQKRGIDVRSLREQIDTSSPAGRFYLHMLAALAQFESELIRERTKAGIDAARRRGVKVGRPRKLSPQQIAQARRMVAAGPGLKTAAATFGVSVSTLRRALC